MRLNAVKMNYEYCKLTTEGANTFVAPKIIGCVKAHRHQS